MLLLNVLKADRTKARRTCFLRLRGFPESAKEDRWRNMEPAATPLDVVFNSSPACRRVQAKPCSPRHHVHFRVHCHFEKPSMKSIRIKKKIQNSDLIFRS